MDNIEGVVAIFFLHVYLDHLGSSKNSDLHSPAAVYEELAKLARMSKRRAVVLVYIFLLFLSKGGLEKSYICSNGSPC